MSAISYAIEALNLLPGLISAGMDVVEFATKTSNGLKVMQAEGRDPTDEEWNALNATVEELRNRRPDVSNEAG